MTRAVRVIRLPNGRQVTLSAYVIAWRQLLEMDGTALIRDWDYYPTEARAVLDAMRDGVHDRINRVVPWWGRGRKWESDWQRAALHCSRRVNAWRVIVRPGDVPKEFRARLATRITWPEEE